MSNILSFDFAYGSAFGFTDLTGDFTAVHFHNPGPVNFPNPNSNAGVIYGLNLFHTASGTTSGRVTGFVVFTAPQEIDLFDNEIYINIQSSQFGGGEIRGQLVVVPEPGSTMVLTLIGLTALNRRRRS